MSINFIDLILKGFFDPVDGENLTNYFFREFKKAEKDHYDEKTFFDGCRIGIICIGNELDRSKKEMRIYLEERLKLHEIWVCDIQDDPSGYKEKGLKKDIANLKKDLSDLDSDDGLGRLTSINRSMSLSDLLYIKNAISRTHLKVVPLSNDEVLQLMNANNLKNLPKELIDRITPDSQKLISKICKYEDDIIVIKENLNKEIQNLDTLYKNQNRDDLYRDKRIEQLGKARASLLLNYNGKIRLIETMVKLEKNAYLKNIINLLPPSSIMADVAQANTDEKRVNNNKIKHTVSQQHKDKTKHEREFFEITERFCFPCTEKEILPSIDKYNYDLFNIIQRFKDEIIENITTLSQNDREFYLKRISKRVNGIIEAVYALDEKTGETHSLGINVSFNDNDEILTIDPKEIDSYFEMISRYKNEMKEFLSKLFNSINSIDQNKDKTDDNTDDIPKTFKTNLPTQNLVKETLIKENFIHKISDGDFDPPGVNQEELDLQIEAKPFPDYFEEKKAEMANTCVTVFNKNKSPKEFAIMFCLLIKRGFLSIPDKRRSNYYNSWYSFINRPLPKRRNYNCINKHIEFSYDKGLHFNENDPDFIRLEQNFNQALKKIYE